ncbi:14735_t:CDS:2 [Funneliformis caledonium]|uniref:14735_t:CDS:1 n=1 Tax=Funneliformis caledonium TaxID=1117310 RepID=A0A9N9BF86_9GLOM|nr:14735_t:CDS:2 [Funneliformis caledonium]
MLRGAVTTHIIIVFVQRKKKLNYVFKRSLKSPSFLSNEGLRQIQNAAESFEISVVNATYNEIVRNWAYFQGDQTSRARHDSSPSKTEIREDRF